MKTLALQLRGHCPLLASAGRGQALRRSSALRKVSRKAGSLQFLSEQVAGVTFEAFGDTRGESSGVGGHMDAETFKQSQGRAVGGYEPDCGDECSVGVRVVEQGGKKPVHARVLVE